MFWTSRKLENLLKSTPQSLTWTFIDAAGNNLENLPDELIQLKNLELLDVSFNNLSSLQGKFLQNFAQLQFLDIKCNRLSTLPKELSLCKRLLVLNAFKNEIHTLHPETFSGMSSIDQIDVSRNFLTAVPTALFTQCTQMTNLKLSGNRLKDIPQEIEMLRNLKRLNLSRNKLSKIPAGCANLPSLVDLDISNNLITHIPPKSLAGCVKLKELTLRANAIQHVPADYGLLVELEVLDIRGTKVAVIPAEYGNLYSLRELMLDLDEGALIRQPPLAICQNGTLAILECLRSVLRGAVDAKHCKISSMGDGNKSIAGDQSFMITSVDKFGRQKNTGNDNFSVQVRLVTRRRPRRGAGKFSIMATGHTKRAIRLTKLVCTRYQFSLTSNTSQTVRIAWKSDLGHQTRCNATRSAPVSRCAQSETNIHSRL